jgi:hypothetical protein
MKHGLAVALLLLACGNPSQPDESASPRPLGNWSTAPEDLSPAGSTQSYLSFSRSRFVLEVRNYGTLPGQSRNDLSAYIRTLGSFSVDGDRLIFHPMRLVWWDGFYGARSPEHVEDPYPYSVLFEDASFTVTGDVLHLEYVSYPFDGPVSTSLDLVRRLE